MCSASDNVVSAVHGCCKILIDDSMRYDLVCTGLEYKRAAIKIA